MTLIHEGAQDRTVGVMVYFGNSPTRRRSDDDVLFYLWFAYILVVTVFDGNPQQMISYGEDTKNLYSDKLNVIETVLNIKCKSLVKHSSTIRSEKNQFVAFGFNILCPLLD